MTNQPVAVFTVDVEDYFHVAAMRSAVRSSDWSWYPSRIEANVDRLLDLLARWNVRATWFVLGWEARQHPAVIRRIADAGHEMGCHSMWHREVDGMSAEEFRADTADALAAIEDATGCRVDGYRAPSFSITRNSLWAIDVLIELGMRFDSSIFPVAHPLYGIEEALPFPHIIRSNTGSIWELPPASVRFSGRRIGVAGGGYFRQLPFFFCQRGIRNLIERERLPAILYVHPWEFDPEQPRLAVDRLMRFRHYRNLGSFEARVTRLLSSLSFVTCGELVGRYERMPATLKTEIRLPYPTVGRRERAAKAREAARAGAKATWETSSGT